MEDDDPRLATILTFAQASALTDSNVPTLRRWSRPVKTRDALVTARANLRRGWPTISLIGLAEAATVSHLRGLGMSMPRVVEFTEFLRERYNERHALAVPRFVTDGSRVYEDLDGDLNDLVTGQGAFYEVLAPFLQELHAWEDGFAGAFRPVGALRTDAVEIDPRFNAGRLSFRRNRVPLFAVVGSLDAGDDVATVMRDYRLMADEVGLVERHKSWLRQVA